MMSAAKVFIVKGDLLRDIGLKHLLSQYFNTSAEIIHPERLNCPLDNKVIVFFTSVESYVSLIDCLAIKRVKVVIFTDKASDKPIFLPLTLNEEELINRIGDLLTKDDNATPTSSGELSAREIEVLRLVALGYLNKEIANELSISINTVLSHRKNITSKLGIRSVSGLSVYAMMNGYISSSSRQR